MQNQRRLRLPPWLAWALWVVVVTLAVVSMVLLVLNRTTEQAGIQQWGVALVEQVLYLSLPTIGLLIATRRPANPLGWLFLLAGLGLSAYGFASGYATYALLREPGALPGGHFMAWLQQWIFALIFIATPFLFLLFPTGRLPSHRWRPVGWIAAACGALILLGALFFRGPIEAFRMVRNPTGFLAISEATYESLFLIWAGTILLGIVGLLLRFRRARAEERQQLKWAAFAALILGLAVALESALPVLVSALVEAAAAAAFSSAIAVAILKYRLYDIDRIISRTLVYGLLTALLGGIYAGVVLVLGHAFGGIGTQPPSWVIAGATLTVAALFQPARRRIQTVVNRRFNRRRYDAAETIEAFSTRLRDQIDLNTLSIELLTVVDQTMQPTSASLWLRPASKP